MIYIVNGKIYIGCHRTRNVDDNYMGSGSILKHAKLKYGKDCFKKEILSIHQTLQDMLDEEAKIVTEEFLARDDVYNVALGGKSGGGWTTGRANILKAHQDGKVPHASTFLGKKHSDKTKKKMSDSKKITSAGDRNSQYGTAWIFNEELKQCMKVKTVDVEVHVSNGWKRGRKMKFNTVID